MLPDYADIKALTPEEPTWYDGNGVPRYAPFHPNMLGVYDDIALLVEIECQSCRKRMLVAEGTPHFSILNLGWVCTLPERVETFTWHDPPRHDCAGAGETMSCIERRIVEAWGKEHFDWVRRPEYEKRLDV